MSRTNKTTNEIFINFDFFFYNNFALGPKRKKLKKIGPKDYIPLGEVLLAKKIPIIVYALAYISNFDTLKALQKWSLLVNKFSNYVYNRSNKRSTF